MVPIIAFLVRWELRIRLSTIGGEWIQKLLTFFYSQTSIPSSLCESVEFMKMMIMQGEYHPFRGPLIDQKGNEKLAPGKTLHPSDILTMNWFVDGVLGSIPSINVLEKIIPY